MVYTITDFKLGNYDYDTLFVEVGEDKIIYQIPCKKGLYDSKIIGSELDIEYLDRPVEI